MRHALSGAALVVFLVLAAGSGESEPRPVQGRYDGPDTVLAGDRFSFQLHAENNGESPVTLEYVVVPGDAIRSLGVNVLGAGAVEPYGDGQKVPITPVTVPVGAEVLVAELDGTAFLAGSPGSIELCEGNGNCFPVYLPVRARGGAEHPIDVTWSTVPTVSDGVVIEVTATLRNVSGGSDIVESLGVTDTTAKWLVVDGSQPPAQGEADELARKVWRYDLNLGPGAERQVVFRVHPTQVGDHEATFTMCTASETFCRDTKVPLEVIPAP